MGKIIKLETERLILRKLKEEDADTVFNSWTNDDDVSKYVRWSTHKNVEETKEYIRDTEKRCKEEGYYSWGIVLKEKNELIGAISAFPSDEGRTEIGYNIAKKHWRNGYTTEALKKVLEYLTNKVGIHQYICSHAVLNPASGAVMRKGEFKYVKDGTCEKFDGSAVFETKIYYLDI